MSLIKLCDDYYNSIKDVYDNIYEEPDVFGQRLLKNTLKPHMHTDKYYLHSYIPVYDELFRDKKDSAIKLLEVGVSQGGSINLFKEYFKNGEVIGCDIAPSPEWLNEFENVTIYCEDFYTETAINKFPNNYFDIVIDDGIHSLESFKFLIERFLYKINLGGLLILEDIPDIEWIDILIKLIPKDVSYTYKVYDLRYIKNRYDDIILVIYI
jgi:hypothetical protein|tara:strand:- start:197 stop:826 length:630 start_codon:yes stop_codon:yes gene_type:complete